MAEKPNGDTLRRVRRLFDEMLLPSAATTAAASALRSQADEIERRGASKQIKTMTSTHATTTAPVDGEHGCSEFQSVHAPSMDQLVRSNVAKTT